MENNNFENWWKISEDQEAEVISKVCAAMFPKASEEDWRLARRLYQYAEPKSVEPRKREISLRIARGLLGGDKIDIEEFCEKFSNNLAQLQSQVVNGSIEKSIVLRKEYKILIDKSLYVLRVAKDWYLPIRQLVNSCTPPRFIFPIDDSDRFFLNNGVGFIEFSRSALPFVSATDLISVYVDKDGKLGMVVYEEIDVRSVDKWADGFMRNSFYIPPTLSETAKNVHLANDLNGFADGGEFVDGEDILSPKRVTLQKTSFEPWKNIPLSIETIVAIVVGSIPSGFSFMGITVNPYIAITIWFFDALLLTHLVSRFKNRTKFLTGIKVLIFIIIWILASVLIYKSWSIRSPEKNIKDVENGSVIVTSLSLAINELAELDKRGKDLLLLCKNADGDSDPVIYNGKRTEWYRDVNDFLETNPVVHKNKNWKHWAGYGDAKGTGFKSRDAHTEKPAPSSAFAEFVDIERCLDNIEYYLREMKKRRDQEAQKTIVEK